MMANMKTMMEEVVGTKIRGVEAQMTGIRKEVGEATKKAEKACEMASAALEATRTMKTDSKKTFATNGKGCEQKEDRQEEKKYNGFERKGRERERERERVRGRERRRGRETMRKGEKRREREARREREREGERERERERETEGEKERGRKDERR